jgi:hypothetical protein
LAVSKYPPELLETLIKRADDNVTGDDYVNWALSALETGFDSPSLRILAGLPSPAWRSDAEPHFCHALEELQIAIPNKGEVFREYAKEVARKIISGETSPEAGAELIERRVVSPLNHPEDLMAWCYLSEGLDPGTYATLTNEELDRAICSQAIELLGR